MNLNRKYTNTYFETEPLYQYQVSKYNDSEDSTNDISEVSVLQDYSEDDYIPPSDNYTLDGRSSDSDNCPENG